MDDVIGQVSKTQLLASDHHFLKAQIFAIFTSTSVFWSIRFIFSQQSMELIGFQNLGEWDMQLTLTVS